MVGRLPVLVWLLLGPGLVNAVRAAAAESPSFVRHVVPILTKAGCNSGACHGSFQGRGGLRLSLLGFDPQSDYEQLFRAARGRRVSPAAPARSMFIRKALGELPHGGGRRLSPDAPATRTLLDYLSAGMPPPADEPVEPAELLVSPAELVMGPGDQVDLQVTAVWPDGQRMPVRSWALYDTRDPDVARVSPEGTVATGGPGRTSLTIRFCGQVAAVPVSVPFASSPSPAESSFVPVNFIDELVAAEWGRLGLQPAGPATDEEFLRRVYLDLIGTLPTAEETRTFLADEQPQKRALLVEALLQRPEYADYWSVKWGDLLRVHRRYVGDKGVACFSGWLRESLRRNVPLDEMVVELLTSQGNVFQNGPVAFYFVDEKPEELAETTAQVFLGVRLQCARCHHHPMEVWGQEDYYGLAAFFTRLEIKQPQELGGQGRFGGSRILRTLAEPSPQRPLVRPAEPRMLGEALAAIPADPDIRRQLAAWIVHRENPYFARNFVNRYWSYLLGRGLVEPVDDLRATNPPSLPGVLDAMALDLVEHDYDLRHLLRTICSSRLYQLAGELPHAQDVEGQFHTHRIPRRLSAEVLLDAVNQVAGVRESFPGMPPGTRAIALPDPTIVSHFLATFGRPERNSPCECARGGQPDLAQALLLMNGRSIHEKITAADGRVARLLRAGADDTAILDELYLSALSRAPTADERSSVLREIAAYPSRQEAWEDVLWALLNSGEFNFNH